MTETHSFSTILKYYASRIGSQLSDHAFCGRMAGTLAGSATLAAVSTTGYYTAAFASAAVAGIFGPYVAGRVLNFLGDDTYSRFERIASSRGKALSEQVRGADIDRIRELVWTYAGSKRIFAESEINSEINEIDNGSNTVDLETLVGSPNSPPKSWSDEKRKTVQSLMDRIGKSQKGWELSFRYGVGYRGTQLSRDLRAGISNLGMVLEYLNMPVFCEGDSSLSNLFCSPDLAEAKDFFGYQPARRLRSGKNAESKRRGVSDRAVYWSVVLGNEFKKCFGRELTFTELVWQNPDTEADILEEFEKTAYKTHGKGQGALNMLRILQRRFAKNVFGSTIESAKRTFMRAYAPDFIEAARLLIRCDPEYVRSHAKDDIEKILGDSGKSILAEVDAANQILKKFEACVPLTHKNIESDKRKHLAAKSALLSERISAEDTQPDNPALSTEVNTYEISQRHINSARTYYALALHQIQLFEHVVKPFF